MAEQKKNIFRRIKDKWNELSDTDKGYIIGILVSSIATNTAWVASVKHSNKKNAKTLDNICNIETQIAYDRGVQDGQIKAYKELLTKPEETMKKMGMDTFKF